MTIWKKNHLIHQHANNTPNRHRYFFYYNLLFNSSFPYHRPIDLIISTRFRSSNFFRELLSTFRNLHLRREPIQTIIYVAFQLDLFNVTQAKSFLKSPLAIRKTRMTMEHNFNKMDECNLHSFFNGIWKRLLQVKKESK